MLNLTLKEFSHIIQDSALTFTEAYIESQGIVHKPHGQQSDVFYKNEELHIHYNKDSPGIIEKLKLRYAYKETLRNIRDDLPYDWYDKIYSHNHLDNENNVRNFLLHNDISSTKKDFLNRWIWEFAFDTIPKLHKKLIFVPSQEEYFSHYMTVMLLEIIMNSKWALGGHKNALSEYEILLMTEFPPLEDLSLLQISIGSYCRWVNKLSVAQSNTLKYLTAHGDKDKIFASYYRMIQHHGFSLKS